ncbi:MAG: hypothetical protein WBB28_20845 [Crinalium sp.]
MGNTTKTSLIRIILDQPQIDPFLHCQRFARDSSRKKLCATFLTESTFYNYEFSTTYRRWGQDFELMPNSAQALLKIGHALRIIEEDPYLSSIVAERLKAKWQTSAQRLAG